MSSSARIRQPAAAVVDGVDVDAVAVAVRACPGVDDLYRGRPGGPATCLPGRWVYGLRVDPHVLEVQVRARWGVPAVEVAVQIRHALRTLALARRVDVIIADLADPAAPELDHSAGKVPITVSGQDQ
ncbi:hypothetical protein Drose_16080 [Dactylosporangium roseum]|uniref:Asp23/Gls24 family envelope stress response protein n=1 Tax=Dactylosporangium roseum TaxID=47989 RepID=A0ABY5ZBY3_9ACTN|nr:hypothetical protein [Dactylosporangium roseum]UWZ39605.1 hypothetical protein Drose_16080 [Dactylosporangium roseum]